MLDVVETHQFAACAMSPALKELPVARLPHRGDRIFVDYRVQRERIVCVEPVGELFLFAGESDRRGDGAHCGKLPNHLVEQFAALGQPHVIDAAVGADDLR